MKEDSCLKCTSLDKAGWEYPCIYCNGANAFSKKNPDEHIFEELKKKIKGTREELKLKAIKPELYGPMEHEKYNKQDSSHNNGGKTDYYDLPSDVKQCQDIIEWRSMNYAQGNIFKAAFCFNTGRHSGTTYERELNKIIYFAKQELRRIK